MTAMIDLRDQTFGRLTVVDDSREREGSHIIWLCACNCGTIDVKTTGKRLRSGKTKSCGCLRREATRARRTIDVTGVEFGYARFVATRGDVYDSGQVSCGCYRNHIGRKRAIDITSQTFGYLTAVRPTDQRSGHDVIWLCTCKSPFHPETREHTTSIAALRKGHTRSCGCLFTDQASQRAIAKMKSPHRKEWPYTRRDGSVVWMRAATEVAWAACLDAAGRTWQYEPRAFLLLTGLRYVPDFHLPEEKCWHEVKGHERPQAMAKHAEFSLGHDCKLIPISEIERASGLGYKDLLARAKQMRDDYNARSNPSTDI